MSLIEKIYMKLLGNTKGFSFNMWDKEVLMVFPQSIKQFVQTLIFATILWVVEIAWLAFLGIVIVKMVA